MHVFGQIHESELGIYTILSQKNIYEDEYSWAL